MHQYKVYPIDSRSHYIGSALVAADSAEEANELIDEFKDSDTKNHLDSYGYSYVYESDRIEDVFSIRKGIVHFGIYYYG